MQTLINRQNLASRWDFESPQSILNFENSGIITRVPNIPSPRYSIAEIEQIESIGLDISPLSPIERKRFEKKIERLEKELEFYKEKFSAVKMLFA